MQINLQNNYQKFCKETLSTFQEIAVFIVVHTLLTPYIEHYQ